MQAARFFLAFMMLCISMFRDFSRPIIAADYLVNLERYKEACVNKLKPQMGCNGRCQMMRKMGAAEGQSPSAPVPPTKPFFGESIFENICLTSSVISYAHHLRHSALRSFNDYSFIHLDDIFHPPSI